MRRNSIVQAKGPVLFTKNGQNVHIANAGDRGVVRGSIDTAAGCKLCVDFGDTQTWVWEDNLQEVT